MSKSDVTKIVAFYLAQLCANLVVTICPARIVVGGSTIRSGLLDGDELLEEVKDAFKKLMQGFPSYTMSKDLDQLLGLSQLGDLSSLEGIWMSSLEAVEERRQSVERILSGALGNETRDRYLARRAQHREPIDARL
jgi:predicted NBD/HSP70 family sugar kinase